MARKTPNTLKEKDKSEIEYYRLSYRKSVTSIPGDREGMPVSN